MERKKELLLVLNPDEVDSELGVNFRLREWAIEQQYTLLVGENDEKILLWSVPQQ